MKQKEAYSFYLSLLLAEAEQALTSKLKADHDAMVQSYKSQLKQLTESASSKSIETDKVKEEPFDCQNMVNYSLEIQVMKDRLEQAQVDLGKSQTENAILKAKLLSRDQQFDQRYKQLNEKYTRTKKQYVHVHSCIEEFHSKVYPKKAMKTESKEDENVENSDSNDDIIEIVMQVDAPVS